MLFFVLSFWISFGSNNVDIYIVSYLYYTEIISGAFVNEKDVHDEIQCRYAEQMRR